MVKNRKALRIGWIVFLLLLCCGCGKKEENGSANGSVVDLMEGIEEDRMGDMEDTSEGGADLKAENNFFIEDTTDFAIELLKESVKGKSGENVMLSPVSVISALAMAANGARGNTLDQMLSAFAGHQDMDSFNRNWGKWTEGLTDTEEACLQFANAIWVQENEEKLSVEEDFLKQNVFFYDADIYKAVFDEDTLKSLNLWVEEKTGGRVKDILDNMDEEAVMYLVNTVVFDADWMKIYQPFQVRNSTFTNAAGEKKDVPFMYSTESSYLEDGNAAGFIKPYKEGYRFVAILPNQGISPEEYLETIDGEHFLDLLSGAKTEAIVKTSVPKFEAVYEAELNRILPSMGIEDAFDWKTADFRGLGTYVNKNIYINRIIHKTFISVGELGTEAVAATVEEAVAEAAEEMEEIEIYEVYLKRPFLYAIVENETNIPVFIGVVNEIG